VKLPEGRKEHTYEHTHIHVRTHEEDLLTSIDPGIGTERHKGRKEDRWTGGIDSCTHVFFDAHVHEVDLRTLTQTHDPTHAQTRTVLCS